MAKAVHTLTLPQRQARMINASEGLRLTVHSGCLWLTRPGDGVDRFLIAGSCIELHEKQVLIQSDRHPDAASTVAARYVLQPLAAARRRARSAMPASDRSSVSKPRWDAPSAWRFMERR